MNILIVTVCFPPRNSPGAQRIYSWAKYWSRAGHQVTVLTTKKTALDGPLSFSLDNGSRNSFQVCEVDYPLWKASTARFGNCVLTGLNSPDGGDNTFKKLKFINKKCKEFIGPLFDIYLPWIPTALRAGRRLAQNQNFDIIISTYTPGASHWIAGRIKKMLKIPWVADFRDLWSDSQGLTRTWQTGPLRTLLQGMERLAVAHADLLITVSEPLRQVFANKYDIPCVTVENGFDAEEFDRLKSAKLFPDDGKLRFVYTGAIYLGRDPSPLFAAVQELMRIGSLSKNDIELIFYGRRLDEIPVLAQNYGLAEIVKIKGLVDRITALQAQKAADGLIFLEREEPSNDGILTSKIFEYFKMEKPILGIGMTRASSAGKLMVEAGVGFPLGTDVVQIKDFLLSNYINNKAPIIEPNWPLINAFSRELLAQKALSFLEKVVDSHSSIDKKIIPGA